MYWLWQNNETDIAQKWIKGGMMVISEQMLLLAHHIITSCLRYKLICFTFDYEVYAHSVFSLNGVEHNEAGMGW